MEKSFTIKQGLAGEWYAVFENEEKAEEFYWIFGKILGCPMACFGQFFNAYMLA